jgi:2-isopropylmalate synthase
LGKGEFLEWEVPYLSIDPKDIGRNYKDAVRVNGQSGKGGVAHLLERDFGIILPKSLQRDFGSIVGKKIDALGREVTSRELKELLFEEYLKQDGYYEIHSFNSVMDSGCISNASMTIDGHFIELTGKGNGPIDAFIDSLNMDIVVLQQVEHSIGEGSDSEAISYIEIKFSEGCIYWGVGLDRNIQTSSIKAIISSLNRFFKNL